MFVCPVSFADLLKIMRSIQELLRKQFNLSYVHDLQQASTPQFSFCIYIAQSRRLFVLKPLKLLTFDLEYIIVRSYY